MPLASPPEAAWEKRVQVSSVHGQAVPERCPEEPELSMLILPSSCPGRCDKSSRGGAGGRGQEPYSDRILPRVHKAKECQEM